MISEVDKKELIKNYNDVIKNNTMVRKIIKKLDVEPETAMKYTSSLEDSANELKNCENCEGLIYCKNRLEGYVFYPEKCTNGLMFTYAPCHYTKEQKKLEETRITRDKEILNASFKDIDLTDKKRVKGCFEK